MKSNIIYWLCLGLTIYLLDAAPAHAFYNPQHASGEAGGLVVANAQPSTDPKVYDGNGNVLYYGYRFYNPSQGRWINRDPLEENGGKNTYVFLGSDDINQWDYLGECGCCAFSLGFFDVKKINDGISFGHEFKVFFTLKASSCGEGDCTLTWKEKADRVPDFPTMNGAKPNEWYDATSMSGSIPKMKWDTHNDPECPDGLVSTVIPDSPIIPLTFGYHRVLEFEITLTSSSSCSDCKNKSLTINATQTLEAGHQKKVIAQDFTIKKSP